MTDSPELELAADDLLQEADALLDLHPSPAPVRSVGVELDVRPRVAVLSSPDESTPPQAIWREDADAPHADLVHAAQVLATALLNSAVPETTRIFVGAAIDVAGGHLRVYARPNSREIALVLRHNGHTQQICRRAFLQTD
jgi:hypothetical protein